MKNLFCLILLFFFLSPTIKSQSFTIEFYSNANCTKESFVANSSTSCMNVGGKLVTKDATCKFQSSKIFIVNFALQYHGSANFAYGQNCSADIFPIDCSIPIFGKLFHCFPVESGYGLYIDSNGTEKSISAVIVSDIREQKKILNKK